MSINRSVSAQLFEKAKTYFPGGVNSPVRAFKSVGGTPLFMERGQGAYIWDADGNRFLDFCMSWGPLILGHAHPAVVEALREAATQGTSFGTPTRKENQLAELILANHRYIEKIRFVSSGTEAAMSAIRLARGYTGRNKIVKFEGCYHGHVDALLVKAGSGLVTLGQSDSAGIPPAYAAETLVLPLNNREAVLECVRQYGHDIAAIAIEPIPANNGLLVQGKEFLQFLRDVCTAHNIPLFFDEVISGFRVGFEGAAGLYGIQPDLVAFGKIIGGGLPVGAYAASADMMNAVAPAGPVYQAGTLSGNPMAMSAGIAQLTQCLQPGFYSKLEEKTRQLCEPVNEFAHANSFDFKMVQQGSIFWLDFSDREQRTVRADQIKSSGISKFAQLHSLLLDEGIYFGPSGYEVGFVSAAHTQEDLERAAHTICQKLPLVFRS